MSKGGVYRYYKSTTDMLYDLMEDGCVYRYNIVDNFLTANKNLDKYDIVSEMIVDKILDDNELSKVYAMFLQEKHLSHNILSAIFSPLQVIFHFAYTLSLVYPLCKILIL